MEVKLFISAVSVEFDVYREPLRHALTRPNVSVKIQEDFKAGGAPTLIKLDDYIQTCDAVIHLAGEACGDDAPASSVRALSDRYTDLATRLPGLAAHVGPGAQPLTYTQWEAWLALLHGKRLFVAKPRDTAPCGPRHVRDAAQVARQLKHLDVLKNEQHVHAEILFDGVHDLRWQLLASPILDLLSDAKLAAQLAGDGATQAEFERQERRAGLAVPLFRHLWRELGSRSGLLGQLAEAVRNETVEDLAHSLSRPSGDAPEGDLLRDAWQRVQLVQAWEPRAAALGLPLSRWQDLAAIVADTDARPAPRFALLRELLLWAMDLGQRTRAPGGAGATAVAGRRGGQARCPARRRACG